AILNIFVLFMIEALFPGPVCDDEAVTKIHGLAFHQLCMLALPRTVCEVGREARKPFLIIGGRRLGEPGHSRADLGIQVCGWPSPKRGLKSVETIVRYGNGDHAAGPQCLGDRRYWYGAQIILASKIGAIVE